MAGFNRDFNDHTDTDDSKPFQGGEDTGEPESSNLPMVIVISLLVLAAFGGVVWVAYNNGVAHGRGDVVAQAAPVEEPPATKTGDGALAPPVKAYQQQANLDEDIPPPSGPAKAPIHTVDAPVATKPPAQLMPPPDKAEPAKPAPAKPAPAKPAPVQTKPAPPPVAPPPAPAAPAAKAGTWVLQIGAYTSESDAQAARKSFQAKHAALLSGYGFHIQKADLGPKGVWYRLRVVGFDDKDAATALCAKLKAEGGACFPGK